MGVRGMSVVCLLLSVLLGPGVLAGGARAAEEPEAKPAAAKAKDAGGAEETPAVKAKGAAKAKKPSIEEAYVQENLEKYLNPTSISFLEDGRVKLTFDFSTKSAEHETIFTPRISTKTSDAFRWTNRDDEYYSSYTYSGTTDAYEFMKGLRLSNSGSAHLDVWFQDDVEAEIWYVGSATSSKRQTAAVVFTNSKHGSIGSDHGTLCGTYMKGLPQKAPTGTYDPIPALSLVRLKLLVRNGSFEAWREGRKRQAKEYKPKDFSSGKIGLLWREARSFVSRLEITGRVDAKKMYHQIRKASK
jgi:hypothetical protein